MNEHQVCERCREETKRPAGFWDGEDEAGRDAGGPMFTCDNPRCKIAKKRRQAKAEVERRRETADELNGAYDIDPEKFREARRRAGHAFLCHCAVLLDLGSAVGCPEER